MIDATFLHNACDMHLHFGPDLVPRKFGALEIAARAADAGMRAVLLKNHNVPTYLTASCTDEVVAGVRVFGGLALNAAVGGINPAAVKIACKLGAKQIWMPTSSAQQHLRHFKKSQQWAVQVFDDNKKPVLGLEEVLNLIAEAGVILGTGHLAPEEILRLTDMARACGVEKVLVTHPEFECVAMTIADQKKLAAMGACFERCYYASNSPQKLPVNTIAEQIKSVGWESTVISSDMGQASNPEPVQALLIFMQELEQCGIVQGHLEYMSKELPANMLGL